MSNLTHTHVTTKESVVTVRDGYQTIKKTIVVDMDTAARWLSTKRQHRYSQAQKKDGSVLLTGFALVCPYCHRETPAYAHFIYRKAAEPRVSKPIIQQWAWSQLSLLNDSVEDSLQLYTPMRMPLQYTCRKCGLRSKQMKSQHSIVIRSKRNTMEISCKLDCIEAVRSLLARPWLPNDARWESPFYETIVFNFKKGRAFIRLGNERSDFAVIRDITSNTNFCEGSIIVDLLTKYSDVRKMVKRAFARHWHGPIPFAAFELSIDACIIMTRFIGYPRSFYDAIPYSRRLGEVDGSFAPITVKLHDSYGLPDIYKNSTLPQIKSVRRLYFEHPGLFFYLAEAELLWDVLRDPNLFCMLLRSKDVFDVFALLHFYPGIFQFIRDYHRIKGSRCLCSHLCDVLSSFLRDGVYYDVMNEYQRKCEHKKWVREERSSRNKRAFRTHLVNTHYSVPMHSAPESLCARQVNGFSFVPIRTTGDCQRAGVALHNCLTEWESCAGSVVVVTKEGKTVAAIEVARGLILQAFASYNDPIETVTGLAATLEKWRVAKHLSIEESCENDDIDDNPDYDDEDMFFVDE